MVPGSKVAWSPPKRRAASDAEITSILGGCFARFDWQPANTSEPAPKCLRSLAVENRTHGAGQAKLTDPPQILRR